MNSIKFNRENTKTPNSSTDVSQPAIACSNLTLETIEQCVKYV